MKTIAELEAQLKVAERVHNYARRRSLDGSSDFFVVQFNGNADNLVAFER